MPITLETQDREKPILLIVGEANPLVIKIIEEYSRDFTIAHVANNSSNPENSDIYHIKPSSASLIKNLEEKVEYAVIFLENENKNFLIPIFEKLVSDKTKAAVIVEIEKEEKFYDVIAACRKVSTFNILLLGDVYSEESEFNPKSESAKIINEAVSNHSINLSGNDLKPLFPIYWKDAITGISQVIFGKHQKSQFFFLFYNHPQSQISAIHELEHVLNDLEVNYEENVDEKFDKSRDSLEGGIQENLGISPIYLDTYLEGFESSIKHFVDRGPLKVGTTSKITNGPKKTLLKQKQKITSVFKLFFWGVVIFILLNFILSAASIFLLKNSISDFNANNYGGLKSNILAARAFSNFTNPFATAIVKLVGFLGFVGLEKNYNLAYEGINLLTIASSDFDGVNQINQGISRNMLDKKVADAFFLYFSGQKLKGEANSATLNALLTPDLSEILAISQVSPEILGFDREKKYLLLFQNNGELRPDGGFIGSVGELDIKNGKIENLNLQDVYAYDGQLKAHVEPYFIIRRYIQPHLYLRDSNFNLDFQESASHAAQLYSLETGKRVDGVIAINFEAVRQIIGILGPIKLSAYNQTLDSNNTFNFLEKTIDNNFFPGSTQKKDVLQSLFNELMSKISNKDGLIKVARLIPILAHEKQILFAFNENSVQSIFSAQNLGGEYNDYSTITQNTLNDFLGVNEANIGVNKANIGVTRSTIYNIDVSSSNIKSRIEHALVNRSDDNYKAFVRFVTPLGSKLEGVKINGVNQVTTPAITDYRIYEKKNFKPPTALEVNQSIETKHQVFGFIVNVASHTTGTIEVDYTNGIDKPDSPVLNYSLLLIKQPGTENYPFVLNLNYGNTYTPQEVKDATLGNGSIQINKTIDEDKTFDLKLLKR